MVYGHDMVLVVDDDLAVRESIKFALEVDGLNVAVCSCGTELLAFSGLRDASLLIIDCEMPQMDGFSVLRRLVEEAVTVPVVLMTVHATERLKRRASSAGVRYVIEKPFFNGSLLDSVHDVLSGKSDIKSVAV